MIPRITRASLLLLACSATLAHGQTAMKLGDLIIFDAFADTPISHYNRDNGVLTPLANSQVEEDGSTLFELDGEIDQAPDGSIYLADLPSSHVVKINPTVAPGSPQSLTVAGPSSSNFTLVQDNLAAASDGTVIRVGYSGSTGAILKHHLDTGTVDTVSAGNLLTANIAAAGVALDGSIVVAQQGSTANLVLLKGTTQIALGSNSLLSGSIYDVEALPNNKAAIVTGGGGLVLATYKLDPITTTYSTTFTNLGNFGGSVQWAKTDVDGNLLVDVYYTASESKILKYDLPTARVDTVLTTPHLTSFGVVKVPVAQAASSGTASLSVAKPSSGGVQFTFSGQLQSSTDLSNWTTLSPQPVSPYTPASLKQEEFFRAIATTGDGTQPLQGGILFRGNSFTYGAYTTGDTTGNGGTPVPDMLKAIASSKNFSFTTGMYAKPAYTFAYHYGDAASLAAVQSAHWHDAVLQNFSSEPTTDTEPNTGNLTNHFFYGDLLYQQQITQDPKVNVWLYETPAYRADSAVYPADFASPDVFQSQLTLNYRQLAKNLNEKYPANPVVNVVPTGEIVQAAGGLLPTSNRFFVQMHAADGQHMSDNRLALTSLAFYVALTHQDPNGLLSTSSVTSIPGLNITVDPRWLEKLVYHYIMTRAYPVVITSEPQSQSAISGQEATFSVTAQGSGPLTYQWFKNGVAIPDSNLNYYTAVSDGSASVSYNCTITNSEGTVTSQSATMTAAVEAAGVKALVDFSDGGASNSDTTFGAAPNDPVNHWNSWKGSGDTGFAGLPATLSLIAPDGSASGITLQSTITGYGAGPNGVFTGTPYPSNASFDYWYGSTNPPSGTAAPAMEFKVTGLKTNRTYKLSFFASRGTGPGVTADNRQTEFKVTGTNTSTQDVDAYANVSNLATVTGMQPDSSGTLTVHVTKGAANTNANGYFYLNVMSISLE